MQSPHTESFYDWKARPANPPAASTALEGCPHLRLLVSNRSELRLRAERRLSAKALRPEA